MSPDRKLGLLTEYDARETQLAVLLENLESFMIRETSNRILRDLTLIKAEKVSRRITVTFGQNSKRHGKM